MIVSALFSLKTGFLWAMWSICYGDVIDAIIMTLSWCPMTLVNKWPMSNNKYKTVPQENKNRFAFSLSLWERNRVYSVI